MTVSKFLVGLSLGSLFVASLSHAAEQKILFKADSIKYRSGTGESVCQERCDRRSKDINALISNGWRIVSSSPKDVIAAEYAYVSCSTCKPLGCTCVGTEYVLQKDDPPTPTPEPKIEAPNKEMELLKKEIELLKQEISLVRQENENLKDQLKTQHKKK